MDDANRYGHDGLPCARLRRDPVQLHYQPGSRDGTYVMTAKHTGWQPIETAPKDDEFLATNGWVVLVAERTIDGIIWANGARWPEATYWMPLPEPPEVSK